eukprot:PhM_4_TR1314/c1_g1_i1/m.52897
MDLHREVRVDVVVHEVVLSADADGVLAGKEHRRDVEGNMVRLVRANAEGNQVRLLNTALLLTEGDEPGDRAVVAHLGAAVNNPSVHTLLVQRRNGGAVDRQNLLANGNGVSRHNARLRLLLQHRQGQTVRRHVLGVAAERELVSVGAIDAVETGERQRVVEPFEIHDHLRRVVGVDEVVAVHNCCGLGQDLDLHLLRVRATVERQADRVHANRNVGRDHEVRVGGAVASLVVLELDRDVCDSVVRAVRAIGHTVRERNAVVVTAEAVPVRDAELRRGVGAVTLDAAALGIVETNHNQGAVTLLDVRALARDGVDTTAETDAVVAIVPSCRGFRVRALEEEAVVALDDFDVRVCGIRAITSVLVEGNNMVTDRVRGVKDDAIGVTKLEHAVCVAEQRLSAETAEASHHAKSRTSVVGEGGEGRAVAASSLRILRLGGAPRADLVVVRAAEVRRVEVETAVLLGTELVHNGDVADRVLGPRRDITARVVAVPRNEVDRQALDNTRVEPGGHVHRTDRERLGINEHTGA